LHNSFICVTLLIHMCDTTHPYVWHDSFARVSWLIHMCDMMHLCVWHDSFICVTWRIHTCDMTHSYVWHDPFICVTWLIHMCNTTHVYRRALVRVSLSFYEFDLMCVVPNSINSTQSVCTLSRIDRIVHNSINSIELCMHTLWELCTHFECAHTLRTKLCTHSENNSINSIELCTHCENCAHNCAHTLSADL